jgi:hypothetical protein
MDGGRRPASGSGALATVTRASLDDRTEGDETVVDFPAAFPFSMVPGSARLRSSADALLNAVGQPGLPPCTSLELVSVRVLDRPVMHSRSPARTCRRPDPA